MLGDNTSLFEEFKTLHDNYVSDEKAFQKQFNEKGKIVTQIIREYEKRLCAEMDKGQYGKFSSNVADKFWEEVRKIYPRIDFVGVE